MSVLNVSPNVRLAVLIEVVLINAMFGGTFLLKSERKSEHSVSSISIIMAVSSRGFIEACE